MTGVTGWGSAPQRDFDNDLWKVLDEHPSHGYRRGKPYEVTSPQDVAGLLGRVRTGTVVITSRRRSGWRAVETVALNVLAAGEAVELLAQVVWSEWPEADLAGAERLCEELGWLPLAVEQAAGYMAQTRTGPAAYLDRAVGDPGRAIPLHEATLADRERVLGPDHFTTRTIRSNFNEARLT